MFRLATIPRIVSNVHYRTRRKTHPKRNWVGRHPDMEPLTSANTEGYVLAKTLKRVYGECLSVPKPNPLPGKSGFNPQGSIRGTAPDSSPSSGK